MKRFTLSVILLALSVMACGMPVSPASVIMDNHTNTSIQTEAETSTPDHIADTREMVVCNSGGLNIRPEAGDLSRSLGWLNDGDSAILRIPATVIEDMGLWYQLADGSGWVNAKYLCEAE